MKSLPRMQRRLLASLEQCATDVAVWRALRSKRTIYLASDGGLQDSTGTFGWIISSKREILYKCSGPVDGPRDTSNSTRSELAGFASGALFIQSLALFWGLRHRCKIRWLADCKAAPSRVRRLLRRDYRPGRQPNDSDLISIIQSAIRDIRRPLTPEWIKGHQDYSCPYSRLPFPAKLNVDADFLALRYREDGRLKPSQLTDHHKGQQVSLSIQGVRITSHLDSCIRFHINGYHLRQFLQKKRKWSDSTWETVDFESFGRHFRRLSPSHQIAHMKLVHDQQPLGKRRHRIAPVKTESLKLCPCCMAVEEDQRHFLTCSSNSGRDHALKTFKKSMLGRTSTQLGIL
jgi:hypothetical protein